jgi:hypothetical protein
VRLGWPARPSKDVRRPRWGFSGGRSFGVERVAQSAGSTSARVKSAMSGNWPAAPDGVEVAAVGTSHTITPRPSTLALSAPPICRKLGTWSVALLPKGPPRGRPVHTPRRRVEPERPGAAGRTGRSPALSYRFRSFRARTWAGSPKVSTNRPAASQSSRVGG